MRHCFWAVVLALLVSSVARSADWAKMEADYKATRERLEKQGPPLCYVTHARGKALIFDPRPEFGIGVHGFDQKVADNLKRANIRFVRQTMYWYAVERTSEPGKYDEAALNGWDRLIELYQKNGLIPEVVVHGNAPGCCFAKRIESYQRFARFMAFVAKRYPYVRYWELWNEMDVGFTDLFGAGIKPEVPLRERGKYYAEMLKLAYPAIKQANPNAVVLTGGLTDWGAFPKGIYEGGGREYFDVMNLHTYGIPLPWGFVQRGALLRQVMNENGDAAKPLWNTEFGLDAGSIVAAWGMPKPAPDVGAAFDKHQKDMIADCLEFNRKAGLYQKCLAYQYAAGNEGMAEEIKKAKPKFPPGMELDDYGFGFVRRDGVTPKPIFQHLIDARVNDAARLAKPVTTKVKLAGQSVTMELNSDYPSAVAVPAGAGKSCPELRNAKPTGAVVPAEWLKAWSNPPAADRPRQIVHAIGSVKALPEGVPQVINESGPDACTVARLSCYKDRGLGGVVCNVDFQDYLRSEQHWKTLARAVESLAKLNMVVWIYDEKGYPSGAAGGLVLKQNPEYEATELAFDPSRTDPFIVRRAYEHTHASNNFFAARRYINLIDDRAVRSFIANTHEAYFKRLGPYFGTTVQATFTDEPSLITIDLGSLKRNVVDPIDPSVQSLPAVPWCYDLPQRFRERSGRELLPLRRSLFAGNSPADRQVRREFWSLIAELIAERYFGAIQTWCAGHHIASSGHTLWEEQLLHHVPLEGNALKALGRMDVPGLDMLTSDPEQVVRDGWMTAALPASAAALHGRRRVMTEISDFSQTYGGHAPATLPEMQATAAWQAAWGVTDFNLYYSPALHPVAKYQAYCDYVGRLNAVLKPAAMAPQVLLYYPIYDLWAEYRPVAEPLQLRSQSRRAQQIINSFTRLGQLLEQSQIAFMLTDHESLSAAVIRDDGKLAINGRAFAAILLPDGVELPAAAANVVERFRRRQGAILAGPWDEARMSSRSLVEILRPDCRISPPSPTIALGRFVRDGRTITLLANVGRQPYEGSLVFRQAGQRQLMDPADGSILPTERPAADRVRLKLAPRQALLVVQKPSE